MVEYGGVGWECGMVDKVVGQVKIIGGESKHALIIVSASGDEVRLGVCDGDAIKLAEDGLVRYGGGGYFTGDSVCDRPRQTCIGNKRSNSTPWASKSFSIVRTWPVPVRTLVSCDSSEPRHFIISS